MNNYTRFTRYFLVVVIMLSVAACSKPWISKTYKPLALSKARAEGIATTAKSYHTQGKLTDAQLDKVRNLYEKGRLANDLVVDSLIASLNAGIDPKYSTAYDAALKDLKEILDDLYNLGIEFKLL